MSHSEPKGGDEIALGTGEPARVSVLVVGAGQAGLAAAQALRAVGLECVVHERHTRIGDSWRQRFDSLHLFSSRETSALPDLPHAGNPFGYPSKNEMGDYLERYAEHFDVPVVTGDGVARLTSASSSFLARTDAGTTVEAGAVIITTGGFQRPRVPDFAESLSEHVRQFDALSYRNPGAVPERDVIVVGDGATGRQIALELAQERRVTLATGGRRYYGPHRVLGKDFTWWGLRTGLITADKASPLGRIARRFDTTPGLHLCLSSLRRAGIRLAPRCVGADADGLHFADGSRRRCDAVIWAVGYQDDTGWLRVDGASRHAKFIEERGLSPIPGLYYVGREWQNSRASGLVCGVHRDSLVIAQLAKDHLAARTKSG
jgi:putative flavoprotein involved in K+ transport